MRNSTIVQRSSFVNPNGVSDAEVGGRSVYCTSGKSLRDGQGQLILRSNVCQIRKATWNRPLLTYGRPVTIPGTDPIEYTSKTWTSGFGLPFTDDVTTASSGTLAQAQARFFSEASNFRAHIPLIYAEREQTLKMVQDRLWQITNAARQLRRGNWRNAARLLGCDPTKPYRRQRFDKAWLEYSYGWVPLLSDIYDVCGYRKPITRVIEGSAWAEGPEVTSISTTGAPFAYRRTKSYTERIHLRALATVTNSALASGQSLGMINPLEIAWELVPFSFVVDWFLPVGAYLEQLTALSGLSLSDACTTTNIVTEQRIFAYPNPSKMSGFTYASSATATRTCHYKVRTLGVPTVPMPPRLSNPLSLNHFLSGLALLTSIFKKTP